MFIGTRGKLNAIALCCVAGLVGGLVGTATALPAYAATGLSATFSSADNGSWFLDKYVVANPTTATVNGSGSDNSWEPNRTGDQANLNTDAADPYPFHFSVADAIKLYTDAGVNPRKLTIGIPFYGRGWQGVTDGGKHGEWQPANGAAPGQVAEEA